MRRILKVCGSAGGLILLMLALGAPGCREQSNAPVTASAAAARTKPAAAAETSPSLRRINVFIAGHVQGVGFRAFTEEHARRLNLSGWVTNLPDGRVQAVIEGPAGNVALLLEAIRTGPQGSRVDKVEINDEPVQGNPAEFRVIQ